jgi:hypothetical protein
MIASIWAPAWIRAFIAPRRDDSQNPDHLHLRVPRLRYSAGTAGLDGPRGRLGIERVGLAVAAAGGTVRAVNFDHGQAVVGQESQQPGTETARALHPDLVHLPERFGPGRQSSIATGRSREAGRAQQPPGPVQDSGHRPRAISSHRGADEASAASRGAGSAVQQQSAATTPHQPDPS